jgi:eukaryotic-like serine/threonine-protein kinase
VSSTSTPTSTSAPTSTSTCPPEMAHVPGARFTMGSNEPPSARPAHLVAVAPFCLDTFEVTVEDYLECESGAGASLVSCPPAPLDNRWDDLTPGAKALLDPFCNARDPAHRDRHPINCVDWTSARLYCAAHGKRLPTESEWELAARGTDGRIYPWGNGGPTSALLDACDMKCEIWKRENAPRLRTIPEALPLVGIYSGDDGSLGTAAVGSFPRGASPYAVEDMAGNVAEWVADEIGRYPASSAASSPSAGFSSHDVSLALPNSVRVVRGGSWVSGREIQVTALIRRGVPASTTSAFIGFRCAKSL